MSATEELKALLDERGVEPRKAFTRVYKDEPDTVNHYTHWGSLIGNCSYHEMESGDYTSTFFEVFGVGVTPEQAIAATLGGGRLTAEQVRGVLLLHLPHREYYSVEQTDAWQELADELNAALGVGECEWQLEHSGTLYDKWRCSECGYLFVESRTDHGIKEGFEPNYCPNCGRKVKEAGR